MTAVTITWAEVLFASEVARMRAIKALQAKQDTGGVLGFDHHMLDCLGELAVAKFMGRYWAGNSEFQVRTSMNADHWLIIRKDDDDDAVFFAATVRPEALPTVDLRGFMRGSAGKLERFFRDKASPPGYYLGSEELWPVEHALS